MPSVSYTNLDEDPQAVHDYGLQRLDEIEAAEAVHRAELGHRAVAALRVFLDVDPENHAGTPAEMVAVAEEWVERAEMEAPQWFGNPPAGALRGTGRGGAHGEERTAGVLYPPAEDGTRPGMYFINTYEPASRPLHQVVPMTFHEAVPGHHFQLTIERHLDDCFRPSGVHGAMLAGGAYVEGWALLLGAPGGGDGSVSHAAGALRGVRDGGPSRRPAGGRYRHPCPRLDAAAVDRRAHRAGRALAARSRDRDGPLHRLARARRSRT